MQVAGEHLAAKGAKKLIFIDADTIVPDREWFTAIERELDQYPLVQGFRTLLWGTKQVTGCVAKSREFGAFADVAPGGCWAMRAEVLDPGFYCYGVVGGADTLFAAGAMRPMFGYNSAVLASPAMHDHYIEWATRMWARVGGNISFVDKELRFLTHGREKHRDYYGRHKILRDFSPTKDLYLNSERMLEWANPDLAARVEKYMRERREDG